MINLKYVFFSLQFHHVENWFSNTTAINYANELSGVRTSSTCMNKRTHVIMHMERTPFIGVTQFRVGLMKYKHGS